MPPPPNLAWTIPPHSTSPQHLTLTTLATPTPGPHQSLIHLTAASLNYRDLLITTHSPSYPGLHKPHLVPCADGAGTILSTGPDSAFAGREGLAVVVHPNTWLRGDIRGLKSGEILGGASVDGTLQTYVVVDDEQVIVAPAGWTGVECAGLLTAGASAWAAVRGWMDGGLVGKWVLTQGTGGVSCAAIQIAARLGATVVATSSSDEKLETARALGAKYLINYKKTPKWEEEVLRITEGKGVDHVIEVAGAQTLMQSVAATRPGGLISIIGILTDADTIPAAFVPAMLFGAKIVKGIMGFSRDASAEWIRFSEANGIKPVVAQVFEFDQAIEAFETLQKQNAVGKLVVKIGTE
ncbi:putative alcohol dehydrogenase [Polyplosphaeria fusca]|uniref:Alcohol dehydrogenase n=1 Tax=Polyplosphaeria fusca TaxID=682080 RepID=A0A9P4V937_9PLEO|nr:putative alcohol dehydrogenase [Polyplosphaeria fusca]